MTVSPNVLAWAQLVFFILASVALLVWIVRQLR